MLHLLKTYKFCLDFRFTRLDFISSNDDKEDINVRVTVKSLGKAITWSKGQKNGRRLTGVFEDKTGKIDLIGWNAVTKYMEEKLKVGLTYNVRRIKVKSCSPAFSKLSKDVQLSFTEKTTIEETDLGVLTCPVLVTPNKDSADIPDDDRVNVQGVIIQNSGVAIVNQSKKLTFYVKR